MPDAAALQVLNKQEVIFCVLEGEALCAFCGRTNRCDERFQWLMMTDKHVDYRRGGRMPSMTLGASLFFPLQLMLQSSIIIASNLSLPHILPVLLLFGGFVYRKLSHNGGIWRDSTRCKTRSSNSVWINGGVMKHYLISLGWICFCSQQVVSFSTATRQDRKQLVWCCLDETSAHKSVEKSGET